MKQWLILAVFILLGGQVVAQKVYRQAHTRLQSRTILSKHHHHALKLRSDLTMVDWSALTTHPVYGGRALKVYVKNIGKLQAAQSHLKVVFSWRFDHESFTYQEMETFIPVPALAINQSKAVWIVIPDHKIKSNQGFGSSHVRIRVEADGTKKIFELSETNNRLYASAPIVHD